MTHVFENSRAGLVVVGRFKGATLVQFLPEPRAERYLLNGTGEKEWCLPGIARSRAQSERGGFRVHHRYPATNSAYPDPI